MNKLEEIKVMFAKKVKVDELDPNAELKSLGLDSLDLVELIMDIEEQYGIEFDNEELVEFKTVGDVLSAIEKKL
ncbi:MAG: acyl carrier protein [Erysipelotrichales bacterium]|nr:acyl carrier protein [Erysipelotrichales bacterium]